MSASEQTKKLRRVEDLAAAKYNGSISAEELAELEGLLIESSESRRLYWEHTANHACLQRMLDGQSRSNSPAPERVPLGAAPPRTGSSARTALRWSWMLLTVAAGLLLTVTFMRPTADNGKTDVAEAGQRVEPIPHDRLGELRALSSDAHWSFGIPGERNKEWFGAGSTLWLNQGAAELTLASGTSAQLEAPLILRMESDRFARLLRGRVTVDVPEGEEGFVVETTAAEVVDLGTTFSVHVADNGDTDVIVFKGEVDVNPSPYSVEGHDPASDASTRLHKGEALRVAEDGTLSRIVNVRRNQFSGSAGRPGVIKEVRDNIVRRQTMKYYEIVAGGIHEDALAFVDRDYQWNGIDKDGLPSYLLGGDYVKTFNDDKITNELRITVTLERPAELYLLVDDRLQDVAWLEEQFVDTGDDVGLDEGPHGVPDDERRLAVGAGVSVDQVHSVWRYRLSGARTVTIGRQGEQLGPEALRMGKKARRNMFGVVAVGLPTDTL